MEEHRKIGGNCEVDISYQYLTFFLEDDAKLKEIETQYTKGELLTGELKKILIDTITPIVQDHQTRRKNITDEELKLIFTPRKLNYQF